MPTVTVNGSTVHYIDSGGGGTPVLLVHAFPLNAGMWQPQIESLGRRFRLIAPDLKGFGGSEAPEAMADYSVDGYADDLRGLLGALGLERIVLVGLSLGGYVALAFLRRHPEVVAALVLADSRAEADSTEGQEKRTAQQTQVREHGTARLIDSLAEALLAAPTRERSPEIVDHAKRLMDNSPQGYISALEAMKNRPDSTTDLVKINVPTLMLVGENDAVTPPEASRKMHEHVRGSRLVVLPDAGHLSNLEAPEAFTRA
ncbi:MAG: alpha/beta hydrolase, partial [Actinomycetota bacterium]|nr:alpha/beta hydrolase [Actinomycetota bacterium]